MPEATTTQIILTSSVVAARAWLVGLFSERSGEIGDKPVWGHGLHILENKNRTGSLVRKWPRRISRGSASISSSTLWNRSTDRSKGLRIQNLSAIAVSAQRAAEPQIVRFDSEKRENVFSS